MSPHATDNVDNHARQNNINITNTLIIESNSAPSNASNLSSIQGDVNVIRSVLVQSSMKDSNGDLTSVEDLQKLLQGLEHADGMAGKVEGRLNELIGTLDNLLHSLEKQEKEKQENVSEHTTRKEA